MLYLLDVPPLTTTVLGVGTGTTGTPGVCGTGRGTGVPLGTGRTGGTGELATGVSTGVSTGGGTITAVEDPSTTGGSVSAVRIAASQSQSIGRSASATTSLAVADASVGTAAVLRIGADFAVRRGGTATLLAGTACPVFLDAALATVFELLLRAGNFDNLADREERETGRVLHRGEGARGGEGDEQNLVVHFGRG
ncbi:unnamed protein product [Fusarium graminearum]|nr:unnamed protein product [Fusarium graminearum]